MTAVISGEADIGFMGSEASVYMYSEGASDYVVNFAQLTQRAGNFLVARQDNEHFQWADLKGKTVLGGRKGGMPEMVFEYILKENGIDPEKDLTIIQNIDFGSTAPAFADGRGDFTIEFEPGATSLESEGKGHVIASLGKDSGYVPYTAFSAKKSYLKENPDVIQRFTNALQKGMDYVSYTTNNTKKKKQKKNPKKNQQKTNALQKGMDYVRSHSPSETASVIKPQFPETTLEMITTIVTRYYEQDTWKSNLIFEESSFDLLQDILESAGELEKRAPYKDLITTEFAENAAK